MRRFLGFVQKEFYHIFRDKRTMLILFGLPIAQILIFGYVITNEIKDMRIAVVDLARDEISRPLTEKIISSGYFILSEYYTAPMDIEKIFQKGDIKQVIIFEPNFAERLEKDGTAGIQLIADASDANTAQLLVNYTSGIIQDFAGEWQLGSMSPIIRPQVRMVFNEELKGVFMFVPGTMALILMLVSAMMTSISIAREKETGTMESLLVSPLKPVQIIFGKVTPYVLLSFINALTIITLGYLVFGVPVKGSLLLLLGESILFIMVALSLGIFISTLSNSQQVAMFISMFALMLPTILLSGFIFPIENMPKILQWLSALMPPKYFIIIIKNIMVKGGGFLYVWKETAILFGMMSLFIILSIRKFKIRLT